MLQSLSGTGEVTRESSCIDGECNSSIGRSSSGVIPSISLPSRFGDSNVDVGRGSIMGVVLISKELGTV